MSQHEFTAKIQNIGPDKRFQITVPKKDVDAGLIDPSKTYRVILVDISDLKEKQEVPV